VTVTEKAPDAEVEPERAIVSVNSPTRLSGVLISTHSLINPSIYSCW